MRLQDCDFSYWQKSVNVARVHRDCSTHVSPCWTVFSWILHVSYCQCVPQPCIEFLILNSLHLDRCSFSHLCSSNIFLALYLPCAWSDYTSFHFWNLIWLGDLLWQRKGQQKCLVYFPEGTLRSLCWVVMIPFSCLRNQGCMECYAPWDLALEEWRGEATSQANFKGNVWERKE